VKWWTISILGLVMGMALWCAPVVHAQDTGDEPSGFVDENGDGIDDRAAFRHRRGRQRMGSTLLSVVSAQLTEEQRAALQEKINALIADGATHAEIQDAVFADLEGFGIDVAAAYLDRFRSALTEDQAAGLKAKLDAMRADGATLAEVRSALRVELAALGVFQNKKGLGRLSGLLTEDQLTGLQEKVDALVEQGVARTEIHKAIQAELMTMGIDFSQKMMGKHRGMRGPRGHGNKWGRGRFIPPPPPEDKSDEGSTSSEGGSK